MYGLNAVALVFFGCINVMAYQLCKCPAEQRRRAVLTLCAVLLGGNLLRYGVVYPVIQGVGFAAGGGVAKAVEEVIHRIRPEVKVKTVAAEGLDECRKMLRVARTGKYNGYLLEGMACPGGCIAGAGTVQPAEKSRRNLERYKQAAPMANPMDTPYLEDIHLVYENGDEWDYVERH